MAAMLFSNISIYVYLLRMTCQLYVYMYVYIVPISQLSNNKSICIYTSMFYAHA